MFQELKFPLSTAILTILSIAAVVCAAVNLEQQYHFRLPDDGVIWADRSGGVQAIHVPPSSPGGKAGVHEGDWLTTIDGVEIENALDVPKALAGLGIWREATYVVVRNGVEVTIRKMIVGEAPFDRAVMYQYAVGSAYLVIGLFVYLRRGNAHKAQHFYIFCLASFIAFCFHFTGKLNTFDKVIYYGNVGAGLLAPTLFLHFCLTFPEPRKWFRQPVRVALLYLPALLVAMAFVLASGGGVQKTGLLEIRWTLDRIWMLFATLPFIAGGWLLRREYRRAEDPIVRRQLQWLANGTLCGILPFALLYVLPYFVGLVPNEYQKMSVLTVGLVPLTLAYAIVRYRLMDVDIIFRRGYAYTLATICVLAAFWGVVLSLGRLVQKNFTGLGNTGVMVVMLTGAFLFQPIRNWMQEWLDRRFYRERYDYRHTLVEFARELSSETDLDAMLSSVGERLRDTLSINHLAFFLADERDGAPRFHMKKAMGANSRLAHVSYDGLDLSFLNWNRPEGYLFFERTRHQLDAVSQSWPAPVRRTIADLDLTYYVPCTVRGRTIAFLGVSRTNTGDYLSSVDVELLNTLAGYVGIAIENATLYRSLQRKVEEYERLKEFSENIVESINVGILAVDLEDRVESWNSQIEQLSGVKREAALGRTLRDLFPDELADQFDRVRGETGIHHIYKFVLKPDAAAVAAANGHNGIANGNGHGNGHIHEVPALFRESTLNIAIAPLVSKDQEQIGRLIIFDDVTDRAELEQRLVQADKLSSIGLLAAGVAHEVNTPLAVISTYAQMLAKQVAEDTQKSLILDKIAKQTFRASEIVNSLLNFSRTSTTSFGDVSLNRVIQETLSLLEHQLTKAGVTIHAELHPELPPVHGNAGKLQQVFLNLFLNARDAMNAGGTLEVRTWVEGSRVRAEVSDTGHGIAPEHIHRIYDPFFTTKAARKGTGLGLSVTYGIIQEHGGSIEVSNRRNGGATFRLELPLSETGARKPVNAA